ncbi:uncharacterized protein LACBIDRAFT_335460 [Laccaria bicolor S238N-H82]|uniref:Predicted protein n=1 Tax=Laccaria bicolor (strain S238N-H82 / ATCC MYA-4686) TaxID=486041 RepID=B0E2D7_LACBS|nr:uncharacterized protein LACBIDRAFT_335460 [Laccaria bicolor S238N-H82]EDQ98996.1 predicted protein [Laccaria bicolor S238N-H82]|eukprot:XP_001890357.1 predicted protein [Laccaria bicolor S238N-H82]
MPDNTQDEAPATGGRRSSRPMPLPGSRGAPNFDKEKPIEMLRFIDQMEDLFKEHGINDDQEKKKQLGRGFRAEQKLLLVPPALVSNRELVELFLGCLRDSFRGQVEGSLNRRAQGISSSSDTRVGVNTTETRTTREHHMHNTPAHSVKLEDDIRELNQKVALLMDKITSSEKAQMSAFQASRQEMNKLTETLMTQHVTSAPTMRQTQPTWRMGQPVPRGTNGKSAKMIVEEASNKDMMAQSNMFASPGEIYTQNSGEPGIIQLGIDARVKSVYTNQIRDSRDDLLDKMATRIDTLLGNNVPAQVARPSAQEVDIVNNMKNILSYFEEQQGQGQEAASYVATRRSQADTQGQQGFS